MQIYEIFSMRAKNLTAIGNLMLFNVGSHCKKKFELEKITSVSRGT